MNRQYYNEYFELERKHWWFRVREKILSDILSRNIDSKRQLRILNIGAATGRSSEMLAGFGSVTSIEYDKDCCEFINERLGIDAIQASILDLPFPAASFDIVCAFDVIEHVEDDARSVAEMHRVCKPQGLVYISVPAFQSLWSHHDVVNRHYRRYRMKNILDLFGPYKGSVVFKTYFNSILFVPIFSFRVLSNIFENKKRRGSGSDFSVVNENSRINRILFKIFSLERFLLKKLTFPAGVSILFLWKKFS